ncbi:MAG TPA: N-acetylglucosamine-6-phosphate deacetylase [Ktedonobacterales bacterium]|jgi:N-acetylglucosamine-6-phosphate deacetylase
MEYILQGARLVDCMRDQRQGDLVMRGSRIRLVRDHVASAIPPRHDKRTRINMSGMIVMPGFIDVHTHGGGGHNLHTADAREIQDFARWAPSTGVTSFLIGVVGVPDGLPEAELRAAVEATHATKGRPEGAEALGIHLEGPYINTLRRGAHQTSWLRMPNAKETERLLALANGHLRIITVAPELAGAEALIQRMIAAGVRVSLGHTDANYEQAVAAIDLGVTHATHCCNAMRALHHRDPGPLPAIVEAPQVYGEIIADGVHVHPAMLRLLIKLLGPERSVVITDALAGAGVPDAIFEFNGQRVSVIGGVAQFDDGTITGSVLTMDQALRNVLAMTGLSLQEAVGMLTANPARAAGVGDRKGLLAPGYDADILIFDASLTLQATMRGGVFVWATDEWLERLSTVSEPLALTMMQGDTPGTPSAPGDK